MYTDEKQNSPVKEDSGYQNLNEKVTAENAEIHEKLIDEWKTQVENYSFREDYDSENPNPEQITNDDDDDDDDDDDFLNSDYPEDDLGEQGENPVDKPENDFNETQVIIEDSEYDEEEADDGDDDYYEEDIDEDPDVDSLEDPVKF